MNTICNKYVEMIKDKFGESVKSVVIYGSNIYNVSSSDLDVCLILDECSSELNKKIIDSTIRFHKDFNLKVDEEIPHANKLIYLTSEIEEALEMPPFYENGNVIIHDIVKTKDFLSSKEMKQRLLFNILTTDHLTIGASTINYEKKAIKIMLDVICSYYNLCNPKPEQILKCFYTNQYTGASGEMYLGYKKNRQEKEEYLIKVIREALND